MDRSVDSIGTCSLDVEASVELPGNWSEGSSAATLRSASLPTPSPEPRLPSYLSLACTVNGYSITTNYDPERLARSRDTSPHRPIEHAQDNLTYTIHNNLLSPPNLVPLPIRKLNTTSGAQNNTKDMAEHTMTHQRQEFYRSLKTVTVLSTDSRNITSNLFSSDSVDSCMENGFKSASRCLNFESKNMTVKSDSQSKDISEKTLQEYSNGEKSERKSFIQQRVERLYGPGALAQGFFVMKRQQNKSFEVLNRTSSKFEKHSRSMNEQVLEEEYLDGGMKQSTSSPTLPVLRHLRPEFRAQLPIMVPKRESKASMQKSVTVPRLDEAKVNGQCDMASVTSVNGSAAAVNGSATVNGNGEVCDKFGSSNSSRSSSIVEKDGHYFLTVLDAEAKRLLVLADSAEKELETSDLPEEAKGYLRSASGKARLLVSQKMQQFKGLCTKNITWVAGEAYPTTNEDLQGFWDMVMLQVDQIDMLFKELNSLRANNWQERTEVDNGRGNGVLNGVSDKPRKMKSRPVSAAAEESRRQREAQRKKMIEDRRKAMREQSKQPRQSIEIFVPESS